MHDIEIILSLLIAVAALATLANKFNVPYPIPLVIGGLLLGFIPGLPRIDLKPDLVFLLFLPPLLYSEAIFASFRDFRANLRPIGLLAVGLVLSTACVVAAVAHALIPGFGWPAAFVLGAVVAPTDVVAAMAIARRLKLPRRLVTVLQGESLVNDASALVVYRLAVAAVVSGAFSLWSAGLEFVLISAGGVVVGLVVGRGLFWVRQRLADPLVENTISILSGFVAYLAADACGVSGVLAVVATGLYLGRQSPALLSAQTRLQGYPTWEVLVFVLNGLLFILVGLQLRHILDALARYPLGHLLLYGVLVSATVIGARIAWVFPAVYLPRLLSRSLRERDPAPPWQATALLAWTGIRGGVSLAAALAIPLLTADGQPFPQRELIIFLTFSVLLITLVGQGLSLPPLIRRLHLVDDGAACKEEINARLQSIAAVLQRLESLLDEPWVPADVARHLQSIYLARQARYAAPRDSSGWPQQLRVQAYARLKRDLLSTERNTLLQLRDQDIINDDVLRSIQHELDLEEALLGDET